MGMLLGLILQVILLCLISVFVVFSELDFLQPPKNISISSTNLIHVLHWKPESEMWGINYSVQIQGEYERIHRNKTWNDVEHCQNIPHTYCDVTDDVVGNVLYAFRVQSLQGEQISAWAEMENLFDRVTTILTPPEINLQRSGLNLIANIQDYGEDFQFIVYFWQKGKEENETIIKMKRSTTSAFLGKIEAGNEYCAYVIAYAIPVFKYSNKSNPVCIKTQAPVDAPLIIGLLCGLIAALVMLALVAWKAMRLIRYSCCPQEDIPDVLKEPHPTHKRVSYSGQNKCSSLSSIELDELIVSSENILDKFQIPR